MCPAILRPAMIRPLKPLILPLVMIHRQRLLVMIHPAMILGLIRLPAMILEFPIVLPAMIRGLAMILALVLTVVAVLILVAAGAIFNHG